MSRSKHNISADSGVPKAVVNRLSLYLRELQQVIRDGQTTISSTRLGKLLGLNDAQVRKDFAYFGQFGYPGIGYKCEELVTEIRQILGTDRTWPIALVGVGNLGQALLGYRGFVHQGFRLIAAFDIDPALVGNTINEIPVFHFDDLETELERNSIKMAVLAVPAVSAQDVAVRLIDSGITGILNFAPVTLNLPRPVNIVSVDLAVQLEQLSYAVVKSTEKS